jgi:hypothetical protein
MDIVQNHVLVCGSFLALNEGLLGNPNIANSGYFLDLLGSLTGKEDRFYVQDKTLGFTQLGATVAQVMVITAVFMVLLPLILLGIGVAVWLRRRHK